MEEVATLYKIAPSYDTTVAVEIAKTGLQRNRKHVLVFERFEGELSYVGENPASARVELRIDADSVRCRDKWLRKKKAGKLGEFVRSRVLKSNQYNEIQFVSDSISAKPLRGYVVEGKLRLCGAEHNVRANVIFGPQTNKGFQIDADAPVLLSDFGIKRPSFLFGLSGVRNDAMIHLLLWASHQAPDSPRV